MKTSSEKLLNTPNGKALVELMNLCGGRMSFCRAIGCTYGDAGNWCNRGAMPQEWAMRVASIPWFANKGWTRERILPSLVEFQWKEPVPAGRWDAVDKEWKAP